MNLPVKKHLRNLERVDNSGQNRSGFLRLDKNESTIDFPGKFIDTLRKKIDSEFLTSYPSLEPLYEKIAAWTGCDRENIYISSGSDGAIKAVFEISVKPEDGVILLSPTYAMFHVYARMFQAKLTEIRYGKGLTISAQKLLKAIKTERPRLVCIANPNSPTGTVISGRWIKKVVRAAAKQNTIVLLDEAYYLFYPVSAIGLIKKYPNLIVTRTFSKAFGLASARVGFACAHREMIKYLQKVRPMYETNSFAVKFAGMILDNYNIVKANLAEVKKGKRYLERQLRKLKIPYYKSYANFMLIDVGSFDNSVIMKDALYKKKILIKGGFGDPCLRNCIRLTIGSARQMKLFLGAFKEATTKFSEGSK